MNGGEFRFYRYDPEDGSEPVDLLSVTSIRSLCGEPYNLVNWKLANIVDAVLGTMKRTVVGPRGGVKDVRQVWEYPSEFSRMYDESKGQQGPIDALRKWLRDRADEPRNIAAIRGTLVHDAIEKNVQWDRIDRNYIEAMLANMSKRDRDKMPKVGDEDVFFVRNAVRQYWDMRRQVPMVILAREVRVVNLTAGYAGTFDALVWLLPEGESPNDFIADKVTQEDIDRIGGRIVLLDWKTAAGIHTDYVVQLHAYLAAEFAITDGKRNERITDMLVAAQEGGLVHIRPNGWGMHLFPFAAETVRAFLGSVAFARFIAKYPDPTPIFTEVVKGESREDDPDVG